jgi:hypothetical protein
MALEHRKATRTAIAIAATCHRTGTFTGTEYQRIYNHTEEWFH